MELAGEVEAVGAAVSEFEVGDQVFGVKGFGAHAEFITLRESAPLSHKPAGMSFEEAASVCDGACTALSCLRGAELRKGRSILISVRRLQSAEMEHQATRPADRTCKAVN
jgi:NADPH:quinone reductase-like Zn-dependent oxidoreductase